jgi:hypothetical protein
MLGPYSPLTAMWLPVRLIQDPDCITEVTGKLYSDVIVQYRKAGSDDWSTLTITAAGWDEQSRGDYDVLFPNTVFTTDGTWYYRVTCAGTINFVQPVLIASTTTGQGAHTVDLTVQSTGAHAVAYCPVTVRNSGENTAIAHGMTDPDGLVSFQLDAGTYKLRFGPRPGYDFTNVTDGTTTGLPFTLVVAAAVTKTLTCAAHAQQFEGFTFGDMKRMVGRTLRREYGKTIDEEDLVSWVRAGNSAVNSVIRWCRYLYAAVSVDGQANYTLYAPCKEIDAVTYEGKPLEEITHREYLDFLGRDSDDALASAQAEATPEQWSRWGDTIYLYPTPDTSADAIQVWMMVAPPLLEEDDDVPEYPAEYHRAIVDYALSVGCRDCGMDDRAVMYLKAFQVQMQTAPQPALDQGNSDMVVVDE